MSKKLVGFVLVGVIAGIVNIGARALLNETMTYELAVAAAFPIALTIAFVLNRSFVFEKGERAMGTQYFRFALVNLMALALVWVVSVGLARIIFPAAGVKFHPEMLAHAIGVASPLALSFFAYKYFIFGGSAKPRP